MYTSINQWDGAHDTLNISFCLSNRKLHSQLEVSIKKVEK